MVAGEHVPDRLRETAGDVDLGDLGGALAAEPALVALVAVAGDGMAAGVNGSFHQRPAQVLRTGVGQTPAPVGAA